MENLLQDRENLRLFKAVCDVPEGYEVVEIDDKTKLSESQYTQFIDSLALKAIEDGTIKFMRKLEIHKEKGKEDVVKFTSKGDAGNHQKNQMGCYIKTSERKKGCPVFEQVNKEMERKQHYLFVGPDDCWRVGPDMCYYSGSSSSSSSSSNLSLILSSSSLSLPVDIVGPDDCCSDGPDIGSYSGPVLKHFERLAESPPTHGWLYYLNDTWKEDNSLRLIVNRKCTGVSQSKTAKKKKFLSNCDCIIMKKFETQVDNQTKEFENVTCLGIAVLRGDTAAIETSLKKGCDINYNKIKYCNQDDLTPLILACRWSSLSIVSLLLAHPGIDIDKRNNEGETALSWAVRKPENLDMVKLLVKAGARINPRDKEGYSHLHRAVDAGALDIVKYLHSEGASLQTHITHEEANLQTHVTPVWRAVFDQNIPMVRYLAENGACLDSLKVKCGFSPFHLAVRNGNVDLVKCMIELGADLTNKSNNKYFGETNTEIAQNGMESGENEHERKENRQKYGEIISMLKAAEENLKHDEVVKTCNCSIVAQLPDDYPNFQNLSCLGIAILQNDKKAVDISLEKGCSVNFDKTYYEYNSGWTPLILACCKSSLPIVSRLLQQPGIKIDKVNEYEESALSWAAKRDDNLDMVKCLVEAGVDPDMRCRRGRSPLHEAADKMQLDIVKYLQSKGAYLNNYEKRDTTPLFLAVEHEDLEMVEYLASEGVSLDSHRFLYDCFLRGKQSLYDCFPLNIAVENGYVDVVRCLIEQGADVDKAMIYYLIEGRDCYLPFSNLSIARHQLEEVREKMPEEVSLYEEIICILKEAGAKEPDDKLIIELILETLEEIMRKCVEKIDFLAQPETESEFESFDFDLNQLPVCIVKLRFITRNREVWLTMVQALLKVVSLEDPMGSIVIEILIRQTLNFHATNVEDFLRVFKMGSSFEANDLRHGTLSIILSCIAGVIKTIRNDSDAIEVKQLALTPTMLDYFFGNFKPGSTSEAAIFSLLALEFLTDEKENGTNINGEIVRKRFSEFKPSDHPLLRIEKLIDSDNLTEKQAGFCAAWYLDNLWTIEDQDVRRPKIINDTNINTRLIPSDNSKYLKVGSTGLELRGNAPWLETAMSTVQVDKGSWYYEVTILTSGFMQIGWATKQSQCLVMRGFGVGDDKFSQSYDGCRQVMWYNGRLKPYFFKPIFFMEDPDPSDSWKPGDVVGAFIDIENEEIVFSLNGVNLHLRPYRGPYKFVFEEVKEGFFAAISLMTFQHCKVNFGGEPFKHAPEGTTFKSLNDVTIIPS